jgi:rubrerythrin
MKIKAGELPPVSRERVQDLKITETLVQPDVSSSMTYQEALLFAMKSEKVAYKLYMDLAAMTAGSAFADVFHSLALEEAKHKLRFEVEYDDHVLEGV